MILLRMCTCSVLGKFVLAEVSTFALEGRSHSKLTRPLAIIFVARFPPALWVYLSEAWNRSKSPYMICFHGPKSIIDSYEFDVELLAQMPTSMHGSKEGHTGYIYQRKGLRKQEAQAYIQDAPCDPVFLEAYNQVRGGLSVVRQAVDEKVEETWSSRRSMTRAAARQHGVILSKVADYRID